ncbi:ABC transporter substrate-binding protein [Terriglobus albidus]|uniref:ABC transporter substrate-binding protein n=1 Tax=Terriglobus albidus TaxID=1592106 RepID=UPI0021E0E38C|nr:cobalamin-binding protein [Terriglobus albidus]
MKKTFAILTLLIATLPCTAARTVTDETGRVVTVPDHPQRIICLVPSITDTVFAIGAGNEVVAISDYVKYPEEATKRPSVGSISNPSVEAILSFHPDLVLGMPHQNQPAILDQLQRFGVPLYIVDPHGMQGILRSVESLGQATAHEAQATAVSRQLKQRIDAVRTRVKGLPVIDVYMPVSYDPVVTIGKGSFISEIIDAAGGHSITSDINQEWPHISLEAVIARAPAALLMMRGGTITLDSLQNRPGWNILPAVKNRRVYYVDKRVSFPSPVAVDALEDLAKQLHP